MNFVVVFALFKYFLPLKKGVGPLLFPILKEGCFVPGSVEFFRVFSQFCHYLPLKGHCPSFEKFPSPTNAMCQI